MAKVAPKDLFDEKTMTFGEHLEELRVTLFKSLIALVIGALIGLWLGKLAMDLVRGPIDTALRDHGIAVMAQENLEEEDSSPGYLQQLLEWVGVNTPETGKADADDISEKGNKESEVTKKSSSADSSDTVDSSDTAETIIPPVSETNRDSIEVDVRGILEVLQSQNPNQFASLDIPDQPIWITLPSRSVSSDSDSQEESSAIVNSGQVDQPVGQHTWGVYEPKPQGAFMAYLKVSLVVGFVIASPVVFYQLWTFIGAGLYPHEKKYVRFYMPFSLFLFFGGMAFCFWVVFPYILYFLLGFNRWMNIAPMIRLGDWISFAVMLPLAFGISFQLPIVMLFLERIGLFSIEDYRSKRRIAVMVIAVISMMLTPADPQSMLAMMIPLVVLYEGGIFLVLFMRRRSPFESEQLTTT